MKKIPSLFKRDYDGTKLVFDEIVEGCEWVAKGEGIATEKFDGTACMIKDGILYKRYDRKLNKKGGRKPAPPGWEACEEAPNEHTGHWPGWMPVGDGPDDWRHRLAWAELEWGLSDGTYELVGPKVGGNPHQLQGYHFWRHGADVRITVASTPRTFCELKEWFKGMNVEGIVWHHPDGRMVKIKRRDFGLPWPVEGGQEDE